MGVQQVARLATAIVVVIATGACDHRLHVEVGGRWDPGREKTVHVAASWAFGASTKDVFVGTAVGADYDSKREFAPRIDAGAIHRSGHVAQQVTAFATPDQLGAAVGVDGVVWHGDRTCSKPWTFEAHLSESCQLAYGAIGGQVGVTTERILQFDVTADLFQLAE